VITYNEAVTCQTGADAAFTYYYTGVATDTITVSAACSGDVLTLTVAATTHPPGSGASIVYTAPATNSATLSVSATGSCNRRSMRQHRHSRVGWTTPAMTVGDRDRDDNHDHLQRGCGLPVTAASRWPTSRVRLGSWSPPAVRSPLRGGRVTWLPLTGTFTLPVGATATVVYTGSRGEHHGESQ
jgi:hypothetical protein